MDDLISRREAVEAIQSLYPDMPIIDVFGSRKRWREKNKQYIECEFVIGILPSAKRNKGKWMGTVCSACGESCFYLFEAKYCPNCGADMRGDENDN